MRIVILRPFLMKVIGFNPNNEIIIKCMIYIAINATYEAITNFPNVQIAPKSLVAIVEVIIARIP